ncbi:MAG: hypothetical protein H0X17_10270 [Deltaproteobacteria bacterium]|nr:hypothetical protein [Deltaproteobacteria bacterium]
MKRTLMMFVLSLATVAAVAGCKKKEEKTSTTTTTTTMGSGSAATDPNAKPVDTTTTTTTTTTGGDMAGMTVDAACDKMVATMTSMATAVDSNKGKCDAMGTALEKWVADNKAFMTWAKTQDADAAKKKEFEEKCGPKMTPAMEKIGPMMAGIGECGENAKVKAAMASME